MAIFNKFWALEGIGLWHMSFHILMLLVHESWVFFIHTCGPWFLLERWTEMFAFLGHLGNLLQCLGSVVFKCTDLPKGRDPSSILRIHYSSFLRRHWPFRTSLTKTDRPASKIKIGEAGFSPAVSVPQYTTWQLIKKH